MGVVREEIRKETLTKEKIKKELKEVYLYNGFIHLRDFALLILCFVIVNVLGESIFEDRIANFSQVAVTLVNIMTIVFCVGFVIGCGFCLYGVFKFFGLLIMASKEKFDIVVDKLTDTKKLVSYNDEVLVEEVQDHKIRPHIRLFKWNIPSSEQYYYRLYFEKYKEYELPEGKLYNWSSINSMNDWQIFRSADICDDFYVVVANNKPLYVYNTKFFELSD